MGGGDERHAPGPARSNLFRDPFRAGARFAGTTPAEKQPDVPIAFRLPLRIARPDFPGAQKTALLINP